MATLRCKDRLESYLRENSVPFQVIHHPLAYTAQEVAAAEHVHGQEVAKVVMAVADGRNIMLALPAPWRVDFGKAGRLLGVKEVRLAREEEFSSVFPDCEVGAMPPFGNLYNVPVYVDRSLTRDERIVFNAGTHTDTISMRYEDFEKLVRPIVADFGHHP